MSTFGACLLSGLPDLMLSPGLECAADHGKTGLDQDLQVEG